MTDLPTAVHFGNQTLSVIPHQGATWFTGETIGNALGLTNPQKAVRKLYARHAREFTAHESALIPMQVQGPILVFPKVGPGVQIAEVRIYSRRGAHRIGMFARTPQAARFRDWLLDLIESDKDGVAQQLADTQTQLDHERDSRIAAELSAKHAYRAHVTAGKLAFQQRANCARLLFAWRKTDWGTLVHHMQTGLDTATIAKVMDISVGTVQKRYRALRSAGLVDSGGTPLHFRIAAVLHLPGVIPMTRRQRERMRCDASFNARVQRAVEHEMAKDAAEQAKLGKQP